MQEGQHSSAAEAWCSNAAAWAAHLADSYPGYRDLTQPVALAVAESRRGLAMLAARNAIASPGGLRDFAAVPGAAAAASGGGGAAGRLTTTLGALMAFPRAVAGSDGAAIADLGGAEAQALAARLALASTQVFPLICYRCAIRYINPAFQGYSCIHLCSVHDDRVACAQLCLETAR